MTMIQVQAQVEYEKATSPLLSILKSAQRPLQAEYDIDVASARAEFAAAGELGRSEYEKKCLRAQRRYDRKERPFRVAFDLAMTPIRAAYGKAFGRN